MNAFSRTIAAGLAGDEARFGEVLGGEADAGTWALRLVGLLATLAVVWQAPSWLPPLFLR